MISTTATTTPYFLSITQVGALDMLIVSRRQRERVACLLVGQAVQGNMAPDLGEFKKMLMYVSCHSEIQKVQQPILNHRNFGCARFKKTLLLMKHKNLPCDLDRL